MRSLVGFSLRLVVTYGLVIAALSLSLPGLTQTQFIDDYVATPAFVGQTRAPLATQSPRLIVTTLLSGLVHPWGLEFLPDGRMLITERPGRLRVVDQDGLLSEPIRGLPAIRAYRSTGLHDLVLDPNFADNRLVYFNYFAPPEGESGSGTDEEHALWTERYEEWLQLSDSEREANPFGTHRIARGRLSDDATQLENVQPIFEVFARRLIFSPDGTLLITTSYGTADDPPQQLNQLVGKVLRINPDGSIPADNPWVGKTDAHPALFARGHRDPEGAAINPSTGELWMVEHGPRGGDELNIIRAGRNYGWPVITYGRNYDTELIGEGLTATEGMEQPIYFWSPSIAPSGMTFYTGDLFAQWQWQDTVFVGSLAGEHLVRLELVGDRVVAEERLLVGLEHRIREVREGPDGALYLLVDADEGRILKLTPKPAPEP